MNQKYELVLGLEIHLQLNTPTKMFCGCKNDPFFSKPNTNVCPVCLGLPGAMPVPNKEAIKQSQIFANVFGCKLNRNVIFERKNYFYHDLPKGFQITCPHHPIGRSGRLNGVRFIEVHLEEDTAKSIYQSDKTLIDFNKSGVPLLEMVTEPDFNDIEKAVSFCKEIQLIARYLKISDADMEKGQMRLEANISVREVGDKNLPNYRVEMKNINSFMFMKKALHYELRRQEFALNNSEELFQETRGFDENTGRTFTQRDKEDAHDYRYFPEPDITPLEFDDTCVAEITTSQLELPSDIRKRLKKGKLNDQYVEILINNQDLLNKYTQLLNFGYSASSSASLVINEISYKKFTAEKIHESEKSKQHVKITSEQDLLPIVQKMLLGNAKVVDDFKLGNENALQFLIGQVMKITQGKADVMVVKKLLSRELT